MIVAAAVLSILAIQRYRDYYGGRFDLGNMTQAVYNTAHGHFLRTTSVDGKQISRLGAHVDPILAVFAIPWFVWPSPMMLLVGQAVIVALAAWPAYRLGLRILGDARAAFFCAVALLLYPPLQYAVLNEFHPVTLAITFLLFAFVFIDEGHWWRAAPFIVLAALCKEEIPLVIAVMGAYFALRKRSLWPLLLTAVAAVYFVIAVKVVLPHYSPGGSPFLNRYADLGSSVSGVGVNIFLKPGVTLGHVFARFGPALPVLAALALRVQLAAEPADDPDRGSRVRPERAGRQRLSAFLRVPLRGRRSAVPLRRRGPGHRSGTRLLRPARPPHPAPAGAGRARLGRRPGHGGAVRGGARQLRPRPPALLAARRATTPARTTP